MSVLAERYAGALFALGGTDVDLDAVTDFLTGNAPLWEALCSPAVTPEEKCRVLSRLPVIADRPLIGRFCTLLARKGRFPLLSEISSALRARMLEARNAAVCVMRCVRPPDEAERAALCKALCRLHQKSEVLLDIRTDPGLLGGFTLQIEGVVYDKSVRGHLTALAQQLRDVC